MVVGRGLLEQIRDCEDDSRRAEAENPRTLVRISRFYAQGPRSTVSSFTTMQAAITLRSLHQLSNRPLRGHQRPAWQELRKPSEVTRRLEWPLDASANDQSGSCAEGFDLTGPSLCLEAASGAVSWPTLSHRCTVGRRGRQDHRSLSASADVGRFATSGRRQCGHHHRR